MYKNLKSEIERCGLSENQLAEKMNINFELIYSKLKGETPISLAEALQIKKILGTVLTLEELFKLEQ